MGDLGQIFPGVGFACLDFDNDHFAWPGGQDIDGAVTLDRVLTPDLVAFALEVLGRPVHPEHVLDALPRLGAGINPERRAEVPTCISKLEQHDLAGAGGDGDALDDPGRGERFPDRIPTPPREVEAMIARDRGREGSSNDIGQESFLLWRDVPGWSWIGIRRSIFFC